MGECTYAPIGEHNCNPRSECVKLICAGGGYRDEDVTVTLTHTSSG